MPLLPRLSSLWRNIFGRAGVERDLDCEVRTYLEMVAQEKIKAGLSPDAARREAAMELGGVEQVKEQVREVRLGGFVDNVLQDLRYGVRQLRRSPAFTAVVILSLAFGIGANTAIFSLIDAVMMKSLPIRQPEQLRILNWVSKGQPYVIRGYDGDSWADKSGRDVGTSFSYPLFEAIRIRTRTSAFSDVCGFSDTDQPLNLIVAGGAGLAKGVYVSGNFFSTLGVAAALGRTIEPSDDAASASPVAVISYAYWTSRFGRDPSMVGKAFTVNGVPFTLVGVAAPEFFGLQAGQPTEAWIPLQTLPRVEPSFARWLPKGETMYSVRTEWWVLILGRLKPGADLRQGSAALDVIVQQKAAGIEVPPPGQRRPDVAFQLPTVELEPASAGLDTLRREFSQPLFVLMCLVGLVLLIACTNAATLLLARSEARQQEIAVRLALGAGRRRVVRQLLTESVLLASAGGALGVILAYWASAVLLASMSDGRGPVQLSVSPDLRVLGFTAIISVLTGVIFGLAPALRSTRLDLAPTLKESAGRVIGGRRAGKGGLALGKGLVAAQGAMSLLLLFGAGLFVRTLSNLETENLGFDRTNLLLFSLDASRDGYRGERLADFYGEVQRRIEAIPGVRSATMSRHFLIDNGQGGEGVFIEGYVPKPSDQAEGGAISVYTHYVGSRFFATFRIPVLLGRGIIDADSSAAPRISVVNHAFARRYFGDVSPIGRRIHFGASADPKDMAIVGVVGDALYGELRREPPPTVYVPYTQHLNMLDFQNFEVRTAGNPMNVAGAVRRVIRGLDRNLPIRDLMTETDQIDQATFQERLFARLSGFFALLALALAGIGLYGITSYAVARRTNEIGIRMALGAERAKILRMVLREAITLVVLGIAIGVPAALAASRLVASLLYGLKPTDPLTIASATAVLAVIALLAGYVPARRASRVDPMMALRHE